MIQSSIDTHRHDDDDELQDFLKKLGTANDWREWDPVKDIKDRLSSNALTELRELMWKQDVDDDEEFGNSFEVLQAARDGDERVVALALFTARSHKILNQMNNCRQTVLHIAVSTCSAPLCRLLITRGADGAVADVWGDTPLHIAAREGRADVIKALTTTLTKYEVHHPYFRVPYKSLPQDNVQSYNHDGRTPIHLAAQVSSSPGHRDCIRALVMHARADIDYRRLGDGFTAAHIAVDNYDNNCLLTCLKLGADSESRNFEHETFHQLAFLHAKDDKLSDIPQQAVALCQRYGASPNQLVWLLPTTLTTSTNDGEEMLEMTDMVEEMDVNDDDDDDDDDEQEKSRRRR